MDRREMERVERELMREAKMRSTMPRGASDRPYYNLQDLEAPFSAGTLAEAASRKAKWHQERADHWEAEAKRLYEEGRPQALRNYENLGKANYTGGGPQYDDKLAYASGRLAHHRRMVQEFSNAAVGFTAHEPSYQLFIPFRIMVELDMAGFILGADVASEEE